MTESSLAPSAADIPALVVAIAGDLLGDIDLSPTADFFSAGGDSLLAMHLVSRLARATGLRLRVRLLIGNPVLGDFAAKVAEMAESGASSATRAVDATTGSIVSTPSAG